MGHCFFQVAVTIVEPKTSLWAPHVIQSYGVRSTGDRMLKVVSLVITGNHWVDDSEVQYYCWEIISLVPLIILGCDVTLS